MSAELKVNVHKRALRAAERVPTNGELQGMLDDEEHLPDQLPLWMRAREHLKRGWDPVTVNKHVESITMPKWIASAILIAILAGAATSWWRLSDQRDILIEMKTELRLAKEAKIVEDSRRDQTSADMQAWREVMNGNLKEIKGMLSQQQVDALERIRKSSNGN